MDELEGGRMGYEEPIDSYCIPVPQTPPSGLKDSRSPHEYTHEFYRLFGKYVIAVMKGEDPSLQDYLADLPPNTRAFFRKLAIRVKHLVAKQRTK